MVLPVFLLFFSFSLLFLFGRREQNAKKLSWLLAFIWLMLTLIATFRSEDMPDIEAYLWFWDGWGSERFEIGFATITDVLRTFTTNKYWFLFVFAALSIGLKITAICRISPLIWASLLIYMGNFFILHDMIQMRCAVASGLLLHALYYLCNHRLKYFFIITGIAILFHYSAIVALPLYFLNIEKCNKWFYICLILISYFFIGITPLLGRIIQYIPIEGIKLLWFSYEDTIGEKLNVFNSIHLLRILVCFFLLSRIEGVAALNKYAILLVKIYAISLTLFVVLSDMPTAAIRISEFYQIVEILLVPMLMYAIKIKVFSRMSVFMISAFFLFYNICINEYL